MFYECCPVVPRRLRLSLVGGRFTPSLSAATAVYGSGGSCRRLRLSMVAAEGDDDELGLI
ncbi:hypothetical protein HanIR_Chr04g0153941 [Helianthus annuus]|nr:hypothetical protein HanIR_Chr04g0153941 [Helianthus annuus]